MREFFRGWRRKVGMVTLVCALILVAAWVRGLIVTDELWFQLFGRSWMISTGHGQACLWSWKSSDLELMNMWLTFPITPQNRRDGLTTQNMPGHWTMSYWPPTMGLTLLSAYLILWKPRQRMEPEHA